MNQEDRNMADAKKEGRTPRDIMRVVFRRKFHFFGAASACALAVLILAHAIRLKYTGETKFTLRTDTAGKSSLSSGNESLEEIKLTLQHELLDQRALEKVISDPQLGLEKGLQHNDRGELTREGKQAQQALAEQIRQQATLSWPVKSTVVDVLSLSVTNSDPNLAEQIPNELVKNYIERASQQITDRLNDSNSSLEHQVNSCWASLNKAKNDRVAFEIRYAKMMPEKPGDVQKRIDELRADIDKLSREKLSAQDKLREAASVLIKVNEVYPRAIDSLSARDAAQLKALVDSYNKSRPTSGPATEPASGPESQPATRPAEEEPVQIVKGPNPDLERLKGQLRELEEALTTEKTLRHRTDEHPTVQALKVRIVQVKKEIEDTPAEVVIQKVYRNPAGRVEIPAAPSPDPFGILTMNRALSEWNLSLREDERISKDLADMKKSREEMLALMANFAPIRQQWEELNKKVDECQRELDVWQGRRNDVQIALAAEAAKKRTHMETIQAARKQFLPSSPRLDMILGGALFAALAGGAAWVLLLNFFDRTITTTDKAMEMFDLPVHGVIGEIVSARQFRIRAIRRWFISPVVCTAVLLCVAAAALSIILRLQWPDLYVQWKSDPLAFIHNHGLVAKDRIIEVIKLL